MFTCSYLFKNQSISILFKLNFNKAILLDSRLAIKANKQICVSLLTGFPGGRVSLTTAQLKQPAAISYYTLTLRVLECHARVLKCNAPQCPILQLDAVGGASALNKRGHIVVR